MEMNTGTDRTWRLLKRRAQASLAAKLKLAGSPSQSMPILIDMERSSEASDLKTNNIQIPLIHGITKGKERRSESCHSGSILVFLISTSVVVLGSVGFGFSVGFSPPKEFGIIEDLDLTLSQVC